MPVQINGQTYYRMAEICREIGVCRATIYRWLKRGLLEKSYKDRRGHRLFTEDDLIKLRTESTKIQVECYPVSEKGKR